MKKEIEYDFVPYNTWRLLESLAEKVDKSAVIPEYIDITPEDIKPSTSEAYMIRDTGLARQLQSKDEK